ncbi:MAG TPA: hypothetical protein PLT80_01580 [Candidatus Syntrophosphaera thermopropionivorans]|nr:hypothetical protein [Candidatus Syntrophosphaera thermopropionivorans]
MEFILPDGKILELEQVRKVSRIRDLGLEKDSIEYSKIAFEINLKGHKIIEVGERYHYADWAEKLKKLTTIRNNLINALKEAGIQFEEE